MPRTFYKSIKSSVKNWWIPLLIGIVFILLGIYGMLNPLIPYTTLSILFSLSFLFSGISEMLFSFTNRDEMDSWGWTFAFGLLATIVGVILILNPLLSMEILGYYIGFLILFRSIYGISLSLELRSYDVKDWVVSLFLSVISLLFAVVILFKPALAGLTLVIWVSLGVIALGIVAIYLALQLRQIKAKTM